MCQALLLQIGRFVGCILYIQREDASERAIRPSKPLFLYISCCWLIHAGQPVFLSRMSEKVQQRKQFRLVGFWAE
jgi:hypothetical protein